jgi:PilZ domain
MSDSGAERRQFTRILGPFDGSRGTSIETPVQIYDLSLGGCFVNSTYDAPTVGRIFTLNLDLPREERISLRVEVVYSRLDYGYAVRFVELTDESCAMLARVIDKLQKDRDDE